MLHRKVVLLQRCRPAVEECRPRSHRFQPLQGIMVHIHLKWHSHEVWTELSHSPYNGEAFQFGGGIGFLSLVKGSRSAADDVLLAFADLLQDCAEACGRHVGVQLKRLAEVGEGSDETGSEEHLEVVEGVLAAGAPVEDRIFLGQGMQGDRRWLQNFFTYRR